MTAPVPRRRQVDAAGFDPDDPDIADDPYPVFAELRETERVPFSRALDAWVLTRYDDVLGAIRAPGVYSSIATSNAPGVSLLLSDPPEHTRLRRLVTRPFTTAMAGVGDRVRETCDRMVGELAEANRHGAADIVTHLADPLPVTIIAELMGVPLDRRAEFRQWSEGMIGGVNVPARAAARSVLEMTRFFDAVVTERRERPGTDLISALVTADEGTLSQQELIWFCILLLIAGNETGKNLIGNLVLELLRHPGEAARLWADPARAPAVVDETLRHDAPVQAIWRTALADVTVGPAAIRQGDRVLLLLGAANRDPRHYPEPDRFDPDRGPADHLTFGTGIHHCLGAPLARLEAQVVLESLARRTRDLRANGPCVRLRPPAHEERTTRSGRPSVRRHPMVRGLRHLPVTFAPGGSS